MAPAVAALIAGAVATFLFADLPNKETYIFQDLKVAFVKGKVSDVE